MKTYEYKLKDYEFIISTLNNNVENLKTEIKSQGIKMKTFENKLKDYDYVISTLNKKNVEREVESQGIKMNTYYKKHKLSII